MFNNLRNRSVTVALTPKPATNAADPTPNPVSEMITTITKKQVIGVVAGAVATYAAVVTVNTLSHIAENRLSK